MPNKRILIIEDDLDNISLVRLLLERENYDVITATNGGQGVEVAQKETIDLIVLDLDILVMDCCEVI